MQKTLSFIVVTPAALPVPSLAIAASRCGQIGILDLEYTQDEQDAIRAYVRLQRFAKAGHYGFKVHVHQRDLLAVLLDAGAPHPHTVILAADPRAEAQTDSPLNGDPAQPDNDLSLLAHAVAQLHARQIRVLLEVCGTQDMVRVEQSGVDGLIAKGNEAGGRVGEETTFVLLQSLLAATALPVYAHGGIGAHTAAACFVAGATGVVLDSQLLLAAESPLSQAAKDRVRRLDGSESLCLGSDLGAAYRLWAEPNAPVIRTLQQELEQLQAAGAPLTDQRARWQAAIAQSTGWSNMRQNVLLLGQDVSFASKLAEAGSAEGTSRPVTSRTVAEIIDYLLAAVATHSESAARLQSLAAGAPLAAAHGTRYPIVQGPMTRVSDTVEFAQAVAAGGGLPFIALALMRQAEVAELLHAVKARLGDRPWGAGILGFVPQSLRQEQLAVIREVHPPFVIIAGGRPDQAAALEEDGIQTYLHVPSPTLLQLFLADGAKRFIFEGRECGGHVGPRASFVLWDNAVDTLLAHLQAAGKTNAAQAPGQEYSVLFAGGIHDGLSGAMVSTLAAPLAELGVRVGVLMGTSYLFTHEAVTARAILPRYQQAALDNGATVLVETGLGHVTRCLRTPFVDAFIARKQELLNSGLDADQIRDELEQLNVGRLRIASKGITRHADHGRDADTPKYVALDETEQFAQGMYMIGQVAGLRRSTCSIAELHAGVAEGSVDYLEAATQRRLQASPTLAPNPPAPSEIAIVGMACVLPGAKDLAQYWRNILNGVDAITEIPRERFDWRRYFDPDRNAEDKIYSRWGGFIGDVPFNPVDYGMPPNSVASIEPMQLLMLEVVRKALDDAGYRQRAFPREETAVIMAVGGGLGDNGFHYGFRTYLPHFLEADAELTARLNQHLPKWTEDSFPGMLLNVLSGRVANRFDLGGPNFVVDAACGSSLAALDIAVKDLEAGRTNMAIVGAADTVQSPFGFMAFSKTQALSPTGRCRPMDVNADGIAISEGLAVIVLKRLADAVRDGDKVYAVIQGVGSSSDGRDRSLTAPRPEGQLRALRRAYRKANFSPTTVDLFEAHGTGTKLGDAVEIEALQTLLREAGDLPSSVGAAVGSVKSMIGHTKSTAGLAGLIKVALGLYHKVLPPTLVDTPNPNVTGPSSAIYVNNAVRPWVQPQHGGGRRAGVSAFGFGGTNFHVTLEEYQEEYLSAPSALATWPSELMLFAAPDARTLLAQLDRLARWLEGENTPPLRDLAYTLFRHYRQHLDTATSDNQSWRTMALTVTSLGDLCQKLDMARTLLQTEQVDNQEPGTLRDIYYRAEPLAGEGKVAFLFPGQGSQYPNMFRDALAAFPALLEPLAHADQLMAAQLPQPLSSYLFPRPIFSPEEAAAARVALTNTAVAQPALGVVSVAASAWLAAAGVRPQMVGGHSYGELVALWQAGVFSLDDLLRVSAARGRLMAEAAGEQGGTMAAIRAGANEVAALLHDLDGITPANLNAPNQTVVSGTTEAVAAAIQRSEAAGYTCHPLRVACAFHSPLVANAQAHLADFLEHVPFASPQMTVFANSTGDTYPTAPDLMRKLLSEQLAQPVYFQKQIEAMYSAGARVFVEVGPRRVLSGLVDEILADQVHCTVTLDSGDNGIASMVSALGQLAAAGVSLELDSFFDTRHATLINLNAPYADPAQPRYAPTTWLVNGGSARPWRAAPAVFEPLPVQLLKEGAAREQHPQAQPVASHSNGHSAQASQATTPTPPSPEPQGPQSPVHEYHTLMDQFLAIHSNVMQAYLARMTEGEPAAHTSIPGLDEMPRTLVADSGEPILRFQVTPVAIPLNSASMVSTAGQTVVIIGGEANLATTLADILLCSKHQVLWLLDHPVRANSSQQTPAGPILTYAVPFGDEAQLGALIAEIRQQHGPLHHAIYLAAPSRFAASSPTYVEWQQAWQHELVALLHVIHALQDEWTAAAGTASFMVATQLGHVFDGSDQGPLATLQGGMAGMIKTLAHELNGVRIKVVDLDPTLDLPHQSQLLWQELAAADGHIEVAYHQTSRYTLHLVPLTEHNGGDHSIHLDTESVILITGGARGITATVAEMLAAAYQPKLILVGRSPLPEEEAATTAGLTDMREIKAALLKQRQEAGESVRLADVEQAYQRLLAARELRRNLATLQASGAEIYYQQVDVRDEAAFGGMIEQIYAHFGRLDGVIHGAGLLEDKLLRDKHAASLQRVVSTKIDSAFLLSRYLQPQSLQFLIFFSSVSGRFGNRGQGDYAAANEVLSKLARQLDARWAGRVCAIQWGPWDAVGMVNDELRQQFARRGVALIPPDVGCALLAEELNHGTKGTPEILVAGSGIQAMAHHAAQPMPARA